ncbi:multidrug effflux MFS transporter [Parasedimentitalea maritima]|uniref:Multidrug effflux MFS transporter n=2 Tax=Parasedimentitalea maritima TaxID=2578117 RepID=A0ABY2V0P1_9RHOB|nr:multidrug effflux MFS transporter [Zongyanglinia marina]
MSRVEFISLIAMMFATIAFSIDAMLPALPEIGAALSADDINRAQLILTAFVFGMGVGTFFTGPLSDAFGRKPVIIAGASLYVVSAAVAWASSSLELLLFARVTMGLGAAGPRVVALAIVRDLYSGREMAKLMSIAMMIFTLVPAIAPMLGTVIIAFAGWRAIFIAFALFAITIVIWMGIRLPEPLAREDRRPFQLHLMIGAIREMFAHPAVRISIFVQTLCMAALFTMLTMVQPVYDVIFDRADSFPFWFGFVALMSGSASLINAAVVVKVGMRRMVTWSLASQILFSTAVLFLSNTNLPDTFQFGLFVAWQTSLFFMVGLTLGNLNAMAMEPMGHIAGMAASVIGAISTVLAAVIAAPIGLFFDGSLLPLTSGILTMIIVAYLLMLHMGRVETRLPAE